MDAARNDLAESRRLAPEDADVLLESARIAEDSAEERAFLEAGVKAHPDEERLYRALVTQDAREGRIEEAVELLEGEAIERFPKSAELRYSLAELMIGSNRFEEARKELAALRKQERQEEERRCVIVGRAVLTHALEDRAFGEQLMTILDRAITKKRQRQLFDLPAPSRALRGVSYSPRPRLRGSV